MAEPNIIESEDDRIALPEARIVKFQYLFDYYDAKDFIVRYIKTGDRKYIMKATNSLLGLWLQIKPEFTKKELALSYNLDITKLDYFLENRNKLPSYHLLLGMFYRLQRKLKKMRVLEITFPEPDIAKDFQRSW
jgi:hypothetical protein